MSQEKFGQLIKDIRTKNNLTQKQLADKYNVSYQAVSKWENGLNMPDTSLILQMSKDFNISVDEMLKGKYIEKKSQKPRIILALFLGLLILIILGVAFFHIFSSKNDFQFKTLSSECENFNISGNISYNEKKSAIYVTNIKYCGGDDTLEYEDIECALYEKNGDIERKISSYKSFDKKITLEKFLQNVTLSVDNYIRTCKDYQDDNLYLSINAKDYKGRITTYKIPLKLDDCN